MKSDDGLGEVNMIYGYFLAFAASALWGLNYALDERVLKALSVPQLYFLHSLFGVLVSASIFIFTGRSLADLWTIDTNILSYRLLGTTLLVGTLAGLAIFGSVQSLTAARASILEISYPFFVAFFSYVIFGEPIKATVLLGGFLMFCGAAVIVSSS